MNLTDETAWQLNNSIRDLMVVFSMMAENQVRLSRGEAPAYGEDAIDKIIGPY